MPVARVHPLELDLFMPSRTLSDEQFFTPLWSIDGPFRERRRLLVALDTWTRKAVELLSSQTCLETVLRCVGLARAFCFAYMLASSKVESEGTCLQNL